MEQLGNIKLYNADCMDIMPSFADKQFDLAIIDPPYGIGQPKQQNLKGYNGRKSLEERLQMPMIWYNQSTTDGLFKY